MTTSSLLRHSYINALKKNSKFRIELYPVRGRNYDRLNESLLREGPTDLAGIKRFALLSWFLPNSTAEAKKKVVSFLRFPCLMSEKHRGSKQWRKLEQKLSGHELIHLAIHLEMIKTLSQKCDSSSLKSRDDCSDAVIHAAKSLHKNHDNIF